MRIGKISVIVIGLVPFNVYGECTPTPDCASIGYTETSCEGDYLACPFDSTKLKCTPCDSSFRYDCSGDNITAGIGSTCGGKYAQCECSSSDYVFSNGQCVCDPSCKVGAIYYSDGTCSACRLENKNPVGVVVKDNELVKSNYLGELNWGGYGTDIEAITNYSTATEAQTDFNGKENTTAIVAQHTEMGLNAETSSAIYCNEYAPIGMENTKGKWYLPAAGELYYYIYRNRGTISQACNKLKWANCAIYFTSSTELNNYKVWGVSSSNGGTGTNNKLSLATNCFIEI